MSSGGLWCMEHMKVFFLFFFLFFFRVCVYCCWEILRFVSYSFFLLPHSLVILFVFQSCKGIKDGRKKTRIPLNSIFILGLTTILWWRMFSWTCRKSHASPAKSFEKYQEITLGKLQVWGSAKCLCVQWVCLAEAATKLSGPIMHVHSLLVAKRKRYVHLSQGGKGFWERDSFWRQISLPIRSLLENCYFYIYFFCWFIIAFFYSLFNPYRCRQLKICLLYLTILEWEENSLDTCGRGNILQFNIFLCRIIQKQCLAN